MPNFNSVMKATGSLLKHYSPSILTGFAVSGLISTSVLAASGAVRANIFLREIHGKDFTFKERLSHTWRFYIPAVSVGLATTACIVGANSMNLRRNAALASAYTLTNNAFSEYKDKVVEVLGEKKEKNDIRDAVAQDKLDKDPINNNTVVITGKGDTLVYDCVSGRYFNSDLEALRKAENDLNQLIIHDTWIELNRLYDILGLEEIAMGEDLGWLPDNLVEFSYSSKLAANGTPCIVLQYQVEPNKDYYR